MKTRVSFLIVALLSALFLGFYSQIDYALALDSSSEFCSILGNDSKPSLLDIDIFLFQGTKGEKVTIYLKANPLGSYTGERATLILKDKVEGKWLLKMDGGSLPNMVSAILPGQGEYMIVVFEQPRIAMGKSFKGAYCLTLQSSKNAWQTLRPTKWVEGNNPPVADAGQDYYDAKVGDTVTLDGRKSYDPDGDIITYNWVMTVPAGSNAILSNPTSVMPSFTPDIPESYSISLTVNDGKVNSNPDEVVVIASRPNVAPTANAGPDQSVVTGSTVFLDGMGSNDPDGDSLAYDWQIISKPANSNASLDDPSSSTPSFLADQNGQYIIQLTVNDGELSSFPDDVIVISATPNAPPIANAGNDQTVPKNTMIQLDGQGSSDPDGNPLTCHWTIVSKPDGCASNLDDPASPTPKIYADKAGEYVFRLVVNDGQFDSDPDTVVVTVTNDPPVADAGADKDGLVGNPVSLDGSGSSDPDGDPLTYQWTVISAPSGSTATADNPTSVSPTFTPDIPGTYTIQLVVNDGQLDSSADTTTITVRVPVPNVVGMLQADAESAILAAHLTVGTIITEHSSTVPVGRVISQNPTAETPVAANSSVSLVVSIGPVNIKSIGPEGGIFEYPNGVILEVPVGAVTETVDIEITDLPCDQVDAILSARDLASHEKHCLRAFSAKPDGLLFNSPVTARVPVPPLTPGWTPLQIEADLDEQTYWIVPGEILYLGNENVIEMDIHHFTEEVAAEAWNKEGQTEKVCQTCAGFKANETQCIDFQKKYDKYQDPCCQILKSERSTCYPNCDCCKEKEMRVKVEEADFQSGDCVIVGANREIIYPLCPPEANYTEKIHDSSKGCPKDMNYEIEIVSDRNTIYLCEKANLTAEISGTSKDGKVLFEAAAFPAHWEIVSGGSTVAKFVGDIPPNGKVVEGLNVGDATIRASAVGRDDLYGDFTLRVEKFEPEIIPGDDFVLSVGQSKELESLCVACPQGVIWRTDMPGVVSLTELSGGAVRVTAIGPGTTNVFAESKDYCGEQIGDLLTVTVTASGYILTWTATMSGSGEIVEPIGGAISCINKVDASWSGSAVIDFNYNVQSLSTAGYYSQNYLETITYPCDFPCYNVSEIHYLSTINDAGVNYLREILGYAFFEYAGYIEDPFVNICISTPGRRGCGNIPALTTQKNDAVGCAWCDPEHLIDNHDIQEYDRFYFLSLPGDLEPDDSTGKSFSKQVQGIENYGSCVYGSYFPVTVTWQIKVVKTP